MAPEGSIINGIVMDADSLGAHVKQFWQTNNIPKKDVYSHNIRNFFRFITTIYSIFLVKSVTQTTKYGII